MPQASCVAAKRDFFFFFFYPTDFNELLFVCGSVPYYQSISPSVFMQLLTEWIMNIL